MVVRKFLRWIQYAPPSRRAEGASALARAYLYSELTPEERIEAEAAFMVMLDDPTPVVREVIAETLAASPDAPRHLMLMLANDLPHIASIVLEASPVLMDAELVDFVGTGRVELQKAIAVRADVSPAVAAAIIEIADVEACRLLLANEGAVIALISVGRLIERFGRDPQIRDMLLDRSDLPVEHRQSLIAALGNALVDNPLVQAYLPAERASVTVREACEKATVALAPNNDPDATRSLVSHLAKSQQLTTVLLIRALATGNILFFEEALIELTGLPPKRVHTILYDPKGSGLKALFERAGLPLRAHTACRAALDVFRETQAEGHSSSPAVFARRMIERVLTKTHELNAGETDQLLALLHKYAAEAVRDEARHFVNALVSAA